MRRSAARELVEHLIEDLKVAFADRILLNKTDLVSEEVLKEVETEIKKINGDAICLVSPVGDDGAAAAKPAAAVPASAVPASVMVAVRARPLGSDDGAAALFVSPTSITLSPGKSEHQFHFDYAYDGAATQEQIYKDLGAPILRKALQGFNTTIFAYGQTGSGKSHTMMGTAGDIGIIPRMSEELFFCVDRALEQAPDMKFLLTCSYLEIYNEVLNDLLVPPPSSRTTGQKEALEIKEHQVLGVYVKGLLEMPVRSRSDLIKLMVEGNSRRVTGETKMNARSSERASKTGAEGARLKEGISINQSLSALGAVIMALAESAKKGKMQYVPYRNSKLTRVLQESLGGNALTVMIANISSAASNLDESHNTLQYADRAKSIKVKATKNEQMSEVGKLREQMELLRKKLADQVGVVQTEEEELQLQKYRCQIEEYELRLQQSFEEKERACAELSEQVDRQRQQLAQQQELLRAQSGENGVWLQVLSPSSPVWPESFLENMGTLHARQQDAEERLERCDAFLAVQVVALELALSQLEQSISTPSGVLPAVDLSRTIDVGSPEGDELLQKLGQDERGRLQHCRHLALRWRSLLEQLSQGDALREVCVGLYFDARRALAEAQWRGQGQGLVSAGEAAAAEKDVQMALVCLQQRLQELQSQKPQLQLQSCGARLLQLLLLGLRSESQQLCGGPTDGESKGAAKLRLLRRKDAEEAVGRLEVLQEEPTTWSQGHAPEELLSSLHVLEQCVAQRWLQRQRLQRPPDHVLEGPPLGAPSVLSVSETDVELRKEIETLRRQQQQMLTVISCQATAIEQVTAGSGSSEAREQAQLKLLAEQAQELCSGSSEARKQAQLRLLAEQAQLKLLAEQAQELAELRSSGLVEARCSEPVELLMVSAELGEVRYQQSQQLQLSEQLLDGHAQQARACREQVEAATRQSAELELEAQGAATLQQQLEQQAVELAEARLVEQQFAKMAADLGCIDAQGRMMKQAELLELRARETDYLIWFEDVKQKMAEGREDGLAMALAQNMAEVRKKDRLIKQKDEELRRLRGAFGPIRDPVVRAGTAEAGSLISGSAWTTTDGATAPGAPQISNNSNNNNNNNNNNSNNSNINNNYNMTGYRSSSVRSSSAKSLLGSVAQGAPALASRASSLARSASREPAANNNNNNSNSNNNSNNNNNSNSNNNNNSNNNSNNSNNNSNNNNNNSRERVLSWGPPRARQVLPPRASTPRGLRKT
ncbi:unnamed protein product [Polarella glacialis]|uniref:Kinesin motor domain-containing protein n=2 Tax=Polarella glacialis TaxID=89957 RepID=A0A813FAZ3_POLGL|nr:unnamed protein product [Polarella glacialis]